MSKIRFKYMDKNKKEIWTSISLDDYIVKLAVLLYGNSLWEKFLAQEAERISKLENRELNVSKSVAARIVEDAIRRLETQK